MLPHKAHCELHIRQHVVHSAFVYALHSTAKRRAVFQKKSLSAMVTGALSVGLFAVGKEGRACCLANVNVASEFSLTACSEFMMQTLHYRAF